MIPFDNINRNRYYGLRVGDLVTIEAYDIETAEVVKYGSDNNRVIVKLSNGNEVDVVAECCTIYCKKS